MRIHHDQQWDRMELYSGCRSMDDFEPGMGEREMLIYARFFCNHHE